MEEAIRCKFVSNVDPTLIHREPAELGDILDVEASHLAFPKTENVSDRLVLQPVRLFLKLFALEIADGLPDLCDDRTVPSSTKAHRLDVRTDQSPLARPVLAQGLAAMDVAEIGRASCRERVLMPV